MIAGYPNGLWDSANNLPLIRRGITASHPVIDYCGRAEFVVDAACFPGSSGSPVVLANAGTYVGKDGGVVVGPRFALLGILFAGPQMTLEGEIITKPIPTALQPISSTKIMIHLGYVLKAREVVRLGDHLKGMFKL